VQSLVGTLGARRSCCYRWISLRQTQAALRRLDHTCSINATEATVHTDTSSRVEQFQKQAEQYLPGGVAGSGRFNPSLGYALFLERAQGPRIFDLDGKDYIDFNLSHGAALLGHGHPAVNTAIQKALETGVLSGYETEHTLDLARKITETIPCAEVVRLANSGTEGTMLTLRLARAFTGRKKYLKFWGHFHGLHDYVMYNAHAPQTPQPPGALVPPVRESAGIPDELDSLVLIAPWKDEQTLERVVKEQGDQIAAIIMEPINYNSGCIVASQSYMQFVRDLTTRHNIVLIYDEVLSAFRTGPSCAQGYYGVTPDLCVISKAVANGVPIAIVAGRKDIMMMLSPVGDVLHSGTYCGNLLSVMAAQACLEEITKPGFYNHIYAVADQLYEGLAGLFDRAGIPARVQGLGARFGIHFGFTEEVRTYADTLKHDGKMATDFLRATARRGVYFHSYGRIAAGHHGFSASHTTEDIDEALNRIESAVDDMRRGRTD
jgi:glutamate-1-semialdehyde 2,1-aminomutase